MTRDTPKTRTLPHKRYERLMKQYNAALLSAGILQDQIMDLLKAHSTEEEHIRRECGQYANLFRDFRGTLVDELSTYREDTEDGR